MASNKQVAIGSLSNLEGKRKSLKQNIIYKKQAVTAFLLIKKISRLEYN